MNKCKQNDTRNRNPSFHIQTIFCPSCYVGVTSAPTLLPCTIMCTLPCLNPNSIVSLGLHPTVRSIPTDNTLEAQHIAMLNTAHSVSLACPCPPLSYPRTMITDTATRMIQRHLTEVSSLLSLPFPLSLPPLSSSLSPLN